jgi:DNA-binding Lrp family transcriptional regulator
MSVTDTDRHILAGMEGGLPLIPRPYEDMAARLGISEEELIGRLRSLIDGGVIKRFGLIVRHHELGYAANAMVVWDVPDEAVGTIGRRMSELPFVTLCYRRERRPPTWPYNLFCMIHGRDRQTVLGQIAALRAALALEEVRYDVLFSLRRFKQQAARYRTTRASETV